MKKFKRLHKGIDFCSEGNCEQCPYAKYNTIDQVKCTQKLVLDFFCVTEIYGKTPWWNEGDKEE